MQRAEDGIRDRRFAFQPHTADSGEIYDRGRLIARIEGLCLTYLQFRPYASSQLSETFPMPLFWWQYADHQDPERNAGTQGKLQVVEQGPGHLALLASGRNAGGTVLSRFHMRVDADPVCEGYRYRFEAELAITAEPGWWVTPNPVQGEVEFCNFWPTATFDPAGLQRKRFSCCAVQRADRIVRIPHHHLETPDKQMIALDENDRFLWLLEDENPVFRLLSADPVHAGVCAYMWDAHFGYKVCRDEQPVRLAAGTRFQAVFGLTAVDRESGRAVFERGAEEPVRSVDPVFHASRLELDRPYQTYTEQEHQQLWPWSWQRSQDVDSGLLSAGVEAVPGETGRLMLVLHHAQAAESAWLAPSLGPAFAGRPFAQGARQRFSAKIHLDDAAQGSAGLTIRLHRPGHGSVFDLSTYELVSSPEVSASAAEWQEVSVSTPLLYPAPDRLHLLLTWRGRGTARFSRLLLSEVPPENVSV